MANQEHLTILRQRTGVWNRWREENPNIRPDLTAARLVDARLNGINLAGANLTEVNLSGANLENASFAQADLSDATLNDTILLRANFYKARLVNVDFSSAYLEEATFSRSHVFMTNFTGAYLDYADFSGAEIGLAVFGYCDLRSVRGLDKLKHVGPSTIGIDTIEKSEGKIPEVFLRGAGIPKTLIGLITSAVEHLTPYVSCFISYSSKDEEFIEQLHANLQKKGIRSWFAPDDLEIGDRIRPTLDKYIRTQDKILVVLSEHSITSQWVEQEVETAMEREREENRTVLLPVRIDDAVMKIKSGWPAYIRKTRHIGDFRRWKDHDAYQKEFSRLLRDLKVEISYDR